MTETDLRAAIADFIRTNFVYDEKRQIGDHESFLGSGILDSTAVVELISFLEDTYHVHFEDEELVTENFDTLAKLVAFMERKTSDPHRQESTP
jgi:acyl carrier protein